MHQDDGGAGLGSLVRGAIAVDVSRTEGRLDVLFRERGRPQCVDRIAGREVAIPPVIAHITADIGLGSGSGLSHGHLRRLGFVIRTYHGVGTAVSSRCGSHGRNDEGRTGRCPSA
ncbi:hypothetical protein SBD_5523 [Streptomyces bottropensis ATCC 25435]|uniref:Uncharacterized protein n=1 Tax=Streptomyces bottropensis ATCC 25435 TaxID=1054862 RepID=M3E8H5_9ACTN|nr:hypothetical protein SBD_5523 [Streptomyces bottropensis ATCC 25435]